MEVIRAHEVAKPLIPVLRGVSYPEFQQRQPEWRQIIGSAAALTVKKAGVSEIMPRILNGLEVLGVKKMDDAKKDVV